MDENAKRRFDAVAELWKRSWLNITERRAYELRVAFTLWTAFAALIALILTKRLQTPLCITLVGASIVGLSLCTIHGLWLAALGKRTAIDRDMAIHYEEILRKLSDSAFAPLLEARLEEMRQKQRSSFDWSRRAQFAVTLTLFVATILTVLAAAP